MGNTFLILRRYQFLLTFITTAFLAMRNLFQQKLIANGSIIMAAQNATNNVPYSSETIQILHIYSTLSRIRNKLVAHRMT